jgi:hypothetical protein
MELRADYAEPDASLEDELGCMDVIFSVEAERLQEVHHSHVFCRSKSPLCTCPVVFDPPAAGMTWIVRVLLIPAHDTTEPDDAVRYIESKLMDIEADSEAEDTQSQPYRLLIEGKLHYKEQRSV